MSETAVAAYEYAAESSYDPNTGVETIIIPAGGLFATNVAYTYAVSPLSTQPVSTLIDGGPQYYFGELEGLIGKAFVTVFGNAGGLIVYSNVDLPFGGSYVLNQGADFTPVDAVTSGSSETISGGATIPNIALAGGSVTVSGTANSVGSVSIGHGTSEILLSAGAALSITGSGALSIANGATLEIVGGSLVVAGSIMLTGALTESGANLYDNGVLVNDGAITLDPSTLTVPSLAGTGFVTIDTGSTLDVTGNIDAGQTIIFEGSLGVLAITDSADILGTIDITGSSATIDITDLTLSSITGSSFDTASEILSLTYGSASTLDLAVGQDISGFSLSGDGVSGTYIDLPCFAAGTKILGLHGEVAVEDVQVGDILVTVRPGGPAQRRVIWTGRRRIESIARHPQPQLVRPVRIRAGAFAPGVPERDLRVSPHHAIYVDGALFEAVSLVNNCTIFQEYGCHTVTYHHIELDAHDVLLAEGLPAESFLDTGNRAMFAGGAIEVLHPDFAPRAGAGFCAPLIRAGAPLAAVTARLAQRAAAQADSGDAYQRSA
jgi:hypothetical protein